MKKEETENLMKIMKAFLNGETIESKSRKSENLPSNWFIHNMDYWNTEMYEYRIKPRPQYRPFNDIEECWQEMQKHQPLGWVKIHGIYYNINEVDSIDKKLYIGTYYYTLESAYADITFADGKPFGVKTTETYTIHICKLVAPLNVVKAVKETLHLDLKEAKNIVDKARKEPCRIDNLSKEAADKIAAEINVCGGEAFVGKN